MLFGPASGVSRPKRRTVRKPTHSNVFYGYDTIKKAIKTAENIYHTVDLAGSLYEPWQHPATHTAIGSGLAAGTHGLIEGFKQFGNLWSTPGPKEHTTPPRQKRLREQPDQTPVKKKPKVKPALTKLPPAEEEKKDDDMSTGVGKVGQRRSGAQMTAEDDEAMVVPPPAKISKIINDYFTVQLPLHHSTRFAITFVDSSQQGVISKQFINLNTLNTPLSSSSNRDYRGRNTWAGLFQFYRVLRLDIRFRWHSANTTHMVGWHLHEDTDDTGWTTRRDMAEAKHGGYDFCYAHDRDPGITPVFNSTTGTKNECIQQYTYSPETWDHHVTKFGDQERWTSVSGSPVVPRYIHYGVVSPYNDTFDDPGSVAAFIHCNVDLLLTVQFREAGEAILMDEINNNPDTNN